MSVCDSNTSVAGSFVSQRARLIRNSAELSDSDSSDAEDPENGDCPQSTQNNSESDSKVDLDKDCNGGNGNNKTVDLGSDKDEDNRSAIKNDGHDEAKRQLHYFRAHVQQLESKLTLLRVREDYKTNYLDEICTLKTALMEKDDQIKALSMELKESKQRAKQTKEKEAGSACKRRDCLVDKEELFYHRKEMQNALDKMKQGQPGKMIDLRNVIRLQRAQLEIDNLKASNAKLKEDYDTMEDKLCSLGAECKQAVSNVKADCDVKIKWLMEENAKLQACLNTETKIMERFDVNNNRKGKMSLQHCVAESKKLVAENSDLQNEIVLVKSDLELAKFDLKKAREEVATYENMARKLKNQLGAIEKEAESAKAKFESQQKALVTSRRNESNFKRELNRALQVSRSCANCARLSFELNQCQIMCNNMAYSHSFVSGNYHEIGRQLNAARGEICAQQWELQDLRSKTRELNGSLEWGKKHHESIVKDLQDKNIHLEKQLKVLQEKIERNEAETEGFVQQNDEKANLIKDHSVANEVMIIKEFHFDIDSMPRLDTVPPTLHFKKSLWLHPLMSTLILLDAPRPRSIPNGRLEKQPVISLIQMNNLAFFWGTFFSPGKRMPNGRRFF